uniref:Uncharacterized protein LOC114349017 n=1 Tax=Diabrotica virgifera virgifera TaxID=50390 RepID=A0A6P7GZS5_DIAVI
IFVPICKDESEVCTIHEAHPNDANNLKCNGKYCVYYQEHKEHYTEARQAYQADQEKKLDSDERIFSVDMQKVLLLPKMSTKNSFFISRLVVFNETFASLGNDENICVMWHEAIRGRSAADVTSAYYNIMKNLSSKVSKENNKLIIS